MTEPLPPTVSAHLARATAFEAETQTNLLQLVLASMVEGVVVADSNGQFVLFNRAAEDILGVGLTDAPLEQWTAQYGCFLPDTVTPFPPHDLPLARALAGEPLVEGEIFIRHAGRPRGVWLSVNATPLRDAHGTVRGAVAAFRDNTRHKRAEQRLAAQYAVTRVLAEEATLAEATPRLLQAIGDAIGWEVGALWTVDEQIQQLRCLEVWQRAGVSADAFAVQTRAATVKCGEGLLGQVWEGRAPAYREDVTQEPLFYRAPAAAEDGLHGGCMFPIEFQNRFLAVLEFYTRQRHTPDEEARQLVGSLGSQIGQFLERKRSAEDLSRAAAELTRSNEELQQFAYVVSHDLREPLRMVAGFCRLLQRRYRGQLDKDADEFIQFAVDGTERMEKLITDLLAYSRVGTRGQTLAPTDANVVYEQALANLAAATAETGAVVTRDPLPTVEADPSQLGQLLQNLLANALKFHGPGTPRIHVTARRQGPQWLFSVADNGIGIEAADLERVFGVFERGHPRAQYPGTGIGLAICKRIVERHGGRIWAESTPGQGAVFYFTLA